MCVCVFYGYIVPILQRDKNEYEFDKRCVVKYRVVMHWLGPEMSLVSHSSLVGQTLLNRRWTEALLSFQGDSMGSIFFLQ